jgi:hypothetical protein
MNRRISMPVYKTGNLPPPFPKYGRETQLNILPASYPSELLYHGYPIAIWDKEYITIWNHGYYTLTTKRRLNDLFIYLDAPYYIYQSSFQWFIRNVDTGALMPYVHRIKLSRHKEVFNPCIM